MNCESGPKAAPEVPAAQRERVQTIAQAKTQAIATGLTAMAAGKWDVTPSLLNAMSHLAWSAVFDLELEMVA